MRLIDEILSSPDSSCFYPNNRYFYAIGNTQSTDLTESCRVPPDAKLLLLACGDIRNILYTVKEVSQLHQAPKSLTFHINDIDDVLLARNTVLLHAVKNIDPDKGNDVDFLWNIWYNLALSEADSVRLKEIFTDILQNPQNGVKFETDECSAAVKKVVKYWLKSTTPLKTIKKEREKLMLKKADVDTQSSEGLSFKDCIEQLYISCDCMVGIMDSKLAVKNQMDDIKTYFRTGSTGLTSGPAFTNPTFLCPDVESQWRVHPQSLPYCVFNSILFDSKLTLVENCKLQLQSQLRGWKSYMKTGGIIKVSMWNGSALPLCHRAIPADLKFDFINASNLCDHISLLNILVACSKRLNRDGVLTAQSMSLGRKQFRTIQQYLDVQLVVPPSFYPTFFGLALADDPELGTSKKPKLRMHTGTNAITVRWVATENCLPGIDLTGSPKIERLLEKLAQSCFKMFGIPINDDIPLNTPLTLVFLLKQMSVNIDGGVKPLLKIVERCIPSEKTLAGEIFYPLKMEWNMLTHYYFPGELDVLVNETLVEVRVPLTCNNNVLSKQSTLTALMSFNRAVVFEIFFELHEFILGRYSSPWSGLTLLYIEGKPGGDDNMMTCVLPKSLLDKLDEWALVQPVPFSGGVTNMVATGPLKHAAKFGPTVETKFDPTRDAKEDNKTNDGTKDLKPLIIEDTDQYAIQLQPSHKGELLSYFEIQIEKETMKTVHFKCVTRRGKGDITPTELHVIVPCPVDSPLKTKFNKTNTIHLNKSKRFVQGPLNLPSRHVAISGLPNYAYDEEHFGSFLGMLFLSDQDRQWRIVQGRGSDALFQVKESLQLLFGWIRHPPPDRPLIKAYRVLRQDKREGQVVDYFDYYPEEMFIGVRGLRSYNGIPTLDVVWLDFEVYGKQFPHQEGICDEATLKFMAAYGGSDTSGTLHCFRASIEEAVLLKKILQVNTHRSEQNLGNYGHLKWCYSSYLQLLYSTTAELDLRNMFQSGNLSERIAKDHKAMTMSRMFAGAMSMGSQSSSGYCPPRGLQAEATQGGIGSHCGYCGETRPDMKKCARCKSVLYCSKACQQLDWKKSHRKGCKPK